VTRCCCRTFARACRTGTSAWPSSTRSPRPTWRHASTAHGLFNSEQTYLQTGVFDPDLTIAFWEHRAQQLVDDREYDYIRLLGELSWIDRTGTPREDIVRYESWADNFVSRYPMTILCLYDLRRMGSSVMMDLLRTHPRLLMGGLLLENPHHIASDDFSAA
jgi:hypothetical protein